MRTTVNILRLERPGAAEAMGPRDADSAASLPGVTGDMSALDLQSLWNIAEDTQGPALALQFLSDFFSLQQARVSRILATLAEEDPAGSANAVRSLHTASSMAGAKHIAERCAIILPLVGARNFTSARVHATALQCDVEALTAASPMLLEQAEARLGSMPAAHA